MSVLVCSCCNEKTVKILFCCAKKHVCGECYLEVCGECLGSTGTCHKCYIRDRPDAGSVWALKQLEGEELERIVKTLHLDPSRKSHNEWITMVATHCGLPMTPRPLQQPKVETPIVNGHVTKVEKTKSVKTKAISSVDPRKNLSSLHSQIVHELSTRLDLEDDDKRRVTDKEADDEVDEGIQADTSPKHTLSKTSPLSSLDSDSEDDHWPDNEPPIEMSSNRAKDPPRPNTYTRESSSTSSTLQANTRPPSWLNKSIAPPEEEEEEEEFSAVDAKILRNIQLRRQLTTEEQRSLDTFETKLQAWKTKGQVQSPTGKGPKAMTWKTVNETPLVTSIRDIISQMNKGQAVRQTVDENRHVIEIKNNEETPEVQINPLHSYIKINKPEVKKQEESMVIFDRAEDRFSRPKTQLPEVHRPASNWNKVPEVKTVTGEWNKVINLRETNQPKPWMAEAMAKNILKSSTGEMAIASNVQLPSRQEANQAKLETATVPIVPLPPLTTRPKVTPEKSIISNFQLLDRSDSNLSLFHYNIVNRHDPNLLSKPTPEKSILSNFQLISRRDSNLSKSSTPESVSSRPDSNLTKLLMTDAASNRRDSNQTSKPTTDLANVQLPNRRDSNLPTQRTVEASVHAPNRRDSNQIKPSSINIVNKTTNDLNKPNQAISFKNDTLNEQSVSALQSAVANEKAIERMDVLQLRKLLRQLNVKSGADMMFKREEMVEEVRRLWLQARSNDKKGPSKEVVIVEANPLALRPKTTPGGAQPAAVRVTSLKTLTSEEQIRNLNLFQLKSLLLEDGSDVAGMDSKAQLVEKAIEKWNIIRYK